MNHEHATTRMEAIGDGLQIRINKKLHLKLICIYMYINNAILVVIRTYYVGITYKFSLALV